MTQILTLLTPDYALQVSDRRVTFPGPRYEDINNKAVVYLSLAAFGYTGAAGVGGRTDLWMTEVLGPTAGLGAGFNALRDAATSEFHKSEQNGNRLAMIACGWDPRPDGSFHGFYATISNCISNQGHPSVTDRKPTTNAVAVNTARFGPVRRTFDWHVEYFQKWMACSLYVAGQRLRDGRQSHLLRSLRRAVLGNVAPMTVVRLLAEEVWAVAAINPLVGSSLMAIAVPRTAARTSGALELIGGQPLPGHITAWYLPGPDASEVVYMPNLSGAGTMMADATLEPP